ncbi:hypothetical protein FRC02_001006 [Tulasnella sp. 418]|nr:hypothetical protein FRC02_001006 [Tulasnella sp. 418]
MFRLSVLALALLSSFAFVAALPTTTVPTTTVATPTTSSCTVGGLKPRATGLPIVAVTPNTPVYKLEVYGSAGGPGTLVPFGFHQGWSFANGGWGALFWSFSCTRYLYLNVEASEYSYKPLIWSWTKVTNYWTFPYGADIGTTSASPFGAVTNFLACGTTLYLQTGTDVPAGQTCVLTKLRIG